MVVDMQATYVCMINTDESISKNGSNFDYSFNLKCKMARVTSI